MRLWSLHPKYLDPKGLVALWREGLLAQKVLQGKTKGYKHHPQLTRFRACDDAEVMVARYLAAVVDEATARGYAFDATKLGKRSGRKLLPVTRGQVDYEFQHLLAKLKVRDPQRYEKLKTLGEPSVHPCFKICEGGIEDWERTSP